MSIPMNALPAEFEAEHGSMDLADPELDPNGDGVGEEEDDLDLKDSARSVWLCKVPKFLLEKWEQAQEEGVILGRVRVYDEKDANGDPKISVLLNNEELPIASTSTNIPPPSDVKGGKASGFIHPLGRQRGAGAGGKGKISTMVPSEYHLRLQNTSSKNLFIFGEKEEEDESTGEVGHRKKRRITSLSGTVQHECQLTPSLSSLSASDSYRSIMRERQRLATEPKRTVKILDVDNATANRLASGVGMSGVKHRVASMVKTTKSISSTTNGGGGAGPNGRMVRMPRNELFDLLFHHFDQAPYWNLKLLNEHVQQPLTFLKEVLSEIGHLVPRGPYVGMWTLKEEFRNGKREEKGGGGGIKKDEDGVDGEGLDGNGNGNGVKDEEEKEVGLQGLQDQYDREKEEILKFAEGEDDDEDDDDDDMEIIA